MIYKFNDNFENVLFSSQLLNLVALKQQPLSVMSEDELEMTRIGMNSFKKYINLSNDLVIDKVPILSIYFSHLIWKERFN